MPNLPDIFASDQPASGLGALGLDAKAFIFQLITFLIVLAVLKRFVFSRLSVTLEKRRQTLEASLEQAKQTEAELSNARAKADELLKTARADADKLLSDAQRASQAAVAEAEAKGSQKAERIFKEAQAQLQQDRSQLKKELQAELADLVTLATEKVISQKLTASDDRRIIENSLKDLAK